MTFIDANIDLKKHFTEGYLKEAKLKEHWTKIYMKQLEKISLTNVLI